MTVSTATLLFKGDEHKKTLTGATPSGTITVSVEGNVIIFQGLKPGVSGDAARYDNENVYQVVKDSTVFTAGQTVYWDPVNTLPATTGMIRMGRCVASAASGDAYVTVRLQRDAREVHQSAVAAGAALTNSTTPTIMGSVTIPANYLQAGDVIKVRGQVIATAVHSTDTLTVALMIGSTSVIATAAVNPTANDVALIDCDIVIRTIGAGGTFVAAGMQTLGTPGTATFKPAIKASTAIDTTAAQVVGIQGTYSVADAGNSARLDVLDVQLLRA